MNVLYLVIRFAVVNILCLYFNGAANKDLYSKLGIKKTATKQEIKKAYRQKAKDTHPDKNPGLDAELAAMQFREIAEAYEVLSDEGSRRNYDRSGKTEQQHKNEQWNNRRSQSQQQSNNFWNFGNFWSSNNQQQQKPGVKYHRHFMDYYHRRSILNSQSRVLAVTSLTQFKDIVLDDVTLLTERYVLLAVYDSRIDTCEDMMNFYVLYPWPFAGLSREGDKSMWWEETMVTTKIDLALNTEGSKEIQDLLDIEFNRKDPNSVKQCPTIAFFPRKSTLNDFKLWNPTLEVDKTSDFQSWVWQQLKITISIVNETPWKLKQWWLDGYRGVVKEDLQPNERIVMSTYLTHSLIFRADFVTGNILNNQSSVMWYTSRIQDDGMDIVISPRCFDRSSDCDRWSNEGFCDKFSRASQHNMDLHLWCMSHCHISCSKIAQTTSDLSQCASLVV